jgi:urease accessory protein
MRRLALPAALITLTAAAASAHPGHGEGTGSLFGAGLAHPWAGLDHLLAMVAVGLLAVRAAGRGERSALWTLPAAFMGAMAVGGLGALAGLPLPGVEWGIAASVLVFGLLIAVAATPRTWVSAAIVAAFGLLHGHAHVAEMPAGGAGAYMTGFLAATAVLHTAGILAGLAIGQLWNQRLVRVAGGALVATSAILFASLI